MELTYNMSNTNLKNIVKVKESQFVDLTKGQTVSGHELDEVNNLYFIDKLRDVAYTSGTYTNKGAEEIFSECIGTCDSIATSGEATCHL